MTANSKKILDVMKNQEEKTLQTLKDLETGLARLQRKIRYYSLVNEAIRHDGLLPDRSDV